MLRLESKSNCGCYPLFFQFFVVVKNSVLLTFKVYDFIKLINFNELLKCLKYRTVGEECHFSL